MLTKVIRYLYQKGRFLTGNLDLTRDLDLDIEKSKLLKN